MGPVWVLPLRPGSAIMSVMSSVHRTSGTLGDITTALVFHGKEGVIGSSPMEGFVTTPRSGEVFCSWGPVDLLLSREPWNHPRPRPGRFRAAEEGSTSWAVASVDRQEPRAPAGR